MDPGQSSTCCEHGVGKQHPFYLAVRLLPLGHPRDGVLMMNQRPVLLVPFWVTVVRLLDHAARLWLAMSNWCFLIKGEQNQGRKYKGGACPETVVDLIRNS